MQYNQFFATRVDTGMVLPYATVTVYLTGTQTLASLFNATGGAIGNPVTASATGLVGFEVADGTYDAVVKSADGLYTSPTLSSLQIYDLAAMKASIGTATTLFTATANGLTPASGGGTVNFLRADGTFSPPPGATYTTFTSTASGLVPASGGGTVNFLRADGTFVTPPSAALFTATTSGTVPSSGGGATNFLRADGTWSAPPGSGTASSSSMFNPIYATGTGASQTIILPTSLVDNQVMVFVNGVYQKPTTNYTISGANLTITTENSGDTIVIVSSVGLTTTLYLSTRTALAAAVTSAPVFLTESGREGTFAFSTANLSSMVTSDPDQAIYVAPSSDTTGASGAWVRKFTGPIIFTWGGAVADDTGTTGTDCYQRLINMLGLITARAQAYDIYRLGETLYFPPGSARGYYCSTPVNINLTMKFKGDWGPVGMPNATPHGIRFPLNSAGFITNTHQTNGYSTTNVTSTYGGGCIFEDMCWYSGSGNAFGGGAGFNRTGLFDGILVRARVNLIRCTILGFARNNVYVAGASDAGGSGLLGNANCTNIVDCTIRYAGRNNVHLKGTDSNACHMRGGYSDYALGWGILDESAIGVNSFDSVHTEFNGLGDGTTNFQGGTCSYPAGGQRYAVAYGQEATASTQTPGTGTAWINMGAGVTGGPTWVTGLTWFSGGSIALRPTAGLSRASNFYIESGQAPPQNNNHGHMEDGMATGWNPGNTGTGQTTIAPSGGPAIRVNYNPLQVAHTANDGAVIEHNIGDGSSGGDARIRSFRNSTMTSSHYVYERVKGTDLIGYEWNLQRLFWFTGANPLNITITQAGRPAAVPYMFMPWLLKIQAYDNSNEGRIQHCGLAAPTTGTFAQGEYVRNMAPAVGQPKGWYCTVGGTPGTWVSEGNL